MAASGALAAGPQLGSGGSTVAFRLPDPDGRLAGVRLSQDARIPGHLLDFRRARGGWELVIARPPLDRMEYLLTLADRGGGSETVPDPANPLLAPGAFGVKSVIEFPGYRPPAWLAEPAGAGQAGAGRAGAGRAGAGRAGAGQAGAGQAGAGQVGAGQAGAGQAGAGQAGAGRADASPAGAGLAGMLEVPAPALGRPVTVATWVPPDTPDDEPLPLLAVHDGPEYAALASLTRYLSAGVAGKWLPRLRAALLAPGHRDRWYSANAGYARALAQAVLPAVAARFATTVRIGMGTSLGALAMLHAHVRHPAAFDALFLQSGSFFTPRFDGHERRFPYYGRIVTFVAAVHHGPLAGRPVPTVLTCGGIEENVENNRLMAATLRERGYRATLHEVRDMHNYTAWRDALDPHLTRLLGQACP